MTQDSQLPSQRSSLVLEPMDAETGDSAQRRRQQVLALLRGRWHWAIILALLLGGTLGPLGYFAVEPEYTSTGSLSIAPDQRPDSEVSGGIPLYDRFLALQADRMRSQKVLEAALTHERWQAVGGGSSRQAMRAFNRNLRINVPRNEQQVKIAFTAETPDRAQAGVEAIIGGYRRVFSQEVSRVVNEREAKLQSQHDQLQRDLADQQDRRARLIDEAGGPGVTERLQRLWERLWRVEDLITEANRQLEAVEAADEGEEAGLAVASIEDIAREDGQMRQLLNQRQAVQSEIQRNVELGIGRNHRRMEALRADLDSLNRRIQDYASEYSDNASLPGGTGAANDINALIGSPEMLRARLQDLQQRRGQLEDELSRLGQLQLQLSDLDEQTELTKSRLRGVDNSLRDLRLRPSDVTRIEEVSTGDMPIAPSNDGKRKQLTAMGGLGGAGLGFGLVMLAGLMDRRFRRLDDAELTLPTTRMLGILPTLPENLADPEQAAITAHCVHHIRTMLQIGGADHRGRVFTVTSPGPGSGKTSLTSALGVSFAASGAKTLLIDCDVIGAGLSRRLGIAAHRTLEDILRREGLVSEQGLAEARRAADAAGKTLGQCLVEMGYLVADDLDRAKRLRQESMMGLFEACADEPFEHCLADTGIDNLYLLPIGDAGPEHAGSLSPAAVHRLLNKARGRFDTVLIDTGPILGSIEASMTAVEADKTLLVVSRGDQKAMVIKSLRTLETIQADTAGIVFNHASADDVERSSYASMASNASQGGPGRTTQPVRADPETAARFGPIGSAVASYSRTPRHDLPPEDARNGSGNGVGTHA